MEMQKTKINVIKSNRKTLSFASNGRDSSLAAVKELFKGCEVSNYFYTTKPKNGEVDTWINSLAGTLK